MFSSPQTHAANPPETWEVVKVADRRWALRANGGTLGVFNTKRDAEAGKTSGFYFNLYHDTTRWYAGERVRNWRLYSEV